MKYHLPTVIICLLLFCFARDSVAASVEKIVMPGPLADAHAELETDCGTCHVRFERGGQEGLCLECHEDVASDVATESGFHGRYPRVSQSDCVMCHSDHKGRSFDIVGLAPSLFEHQYTDFPLAGKHQQVVCTDCHLENQKFREANATCEGCHQEDDPHGDTESSCQLCHSETGWLEVGFEHAEHTSFELLGSHAGLSCRSCHEDISFHGQTGDCTSCHAADDVHDGSRGDDCASCHSQDTWEQTSFNHALDTEFDLVGAHEDLSCRSCHLEDLALLKPPDTCQGCHGASDPHLGRHGDSCDECHNNQSWDVKFDHKQVAGFALLGSHQNLACDACHNGSLSEPIESSCFACHVSDDPHGGAMPACGDCHGSNTWGKGVSFSHALTDFPLLGVHRFTGCEQCHADLKFTKTGNTACVDCHKTEDKHEGALGGDCQSCHSPVGWSMWRFDHTQSTQFALTGAHEDLVCSACHQSGKREPEQSCVSCHRSDDPHRMSFGADCQRCHTTSEFDVLKQGVGVKRRGK